LPEGFGSDFCHTGVYPDPDWDPAVKTSSIWEDEWSVIWARLSGDITMGQPALHPLLSYDWLDTFRWPDYSKKERYLQMQEDVKKNTGDKFVLASIAFSLMHRLEYLRGHVNAWTDPYIYPEQLRTLLGILSELAILQIDNVAESGVDGIFSADDLGFQDRPMVSPEIFHEFFAPYYKRVYQHAKRKGLLTFLHSCGYIIDLLDDLIDAGLHVIQMDQQENMGVENLAKRFGGRVCFYCPVDIQNTMNKGTVEHVRAYSRKLIDILGAFDGGFIAKWYPAPEAAGHSIAKVRAMSEEFISYGSDFYRQRT